MTQETENIIDLIHSWITFYKEHVHVFEDEYFKALKTYKLEEAYKFRAWKREEETAAEALEILEKEILKKIAKATE